ncbi:MAG: hypothetical protein GX552_03515 [Chloroflexi bacterium]|jgi:hypothetical protein|nr:hypothetical protein [Chloroflexota bacterium]
MQVESRPSPGSQRVARLRRLVAHVRARPLAVLGVSLLATLLFAGGIVLAFEGDTEWYLLYYFVPIGVPFVAHVLERSEPWPTLTPRQRLIEKLVVGLSLLRAVCPVPLISGHALFLTYALLATSSTLVRITAGLVLLEVAYLKIFAWRDPTIIGGVLLGIVASLAYRRFRRP